MTDVGALALERSGPLVSPFTILGVALLLLAALACASHVRVRARYPQAFPEIGAFASLVLVHLLFFWQPYRTNARVPKGGGDLASFFYPMHAFAAREVQDGRLPLWNPHLFAGAPHLANFQTGALYPPNLLAYLIARPFDYAALEMLALLHYVVASWGTYWLARSLGASRPGGVLAGAIFASSGFLVAHLGHYSMLATAAWLPWVYAAIVASVRRASWAASLGGALALALATLGGHQPILLMGLTLALVVAAFEVARGMQLHSPLARAARGGVRGWDGSAIRVIVAPLVVRERRAAVARLVFMAVVALLVALPVLGPSFELTGRTVRGGLSYAEASAFAVEPTALLHLVTPTVFGSNPSDYWGPFSNTEIWGYAGILTVFLAALGVAARRSRTALFWLIVVAISLVYLVGPFAPLHGWVYAFLPGYDRVRAAGRAMLFVDLALALLAAFGLDVLLRGRSGWTLREQAVIRRGVYALGGALLFVIAAPIPLMAARVLGVNDPGNRPVIALDNLILLALWLALGLGVAAAILHGVLRGGALVGAVCVAVLLDVFAATAPFNPTTDRLLAGYEHPETVAFLRERQAQDGPFRIEVITPRWQPNLALLAGIDDIGGLFDPLALADYDRYRARALTERATEAYRNLNARYIVADDGQASPPGYREAFRASDGIVLWEAPAWRPRAWIEGSATPVEIEIVSPRRIDITLPIGEAGRLVISQAYYPGWRAMVDGRTVEIEAYNEVLQSVALPAGARLVRLEFSPVHWMGWLAGAAVGALLWVGVAGWRLREYWRQRGGRVLSGVSAEGASRCA